MNGRSGALPDEAYAVALLSLPALWPGRLAALLGLHREGKEPPPSLLDESDRPRSAAEAWALVTSGRVARDLAVRQALGPRVDGAAVTAEWVKRATVVDVGALWDRHRRAGVVVDLLGSPGYPGALARDPAAPYALFRSGAQPALRPPCVAIVGTRRCTPLGREIALEFGDELTAAGARVVSGLALGIDAAAHEGALRATRRQLAARDDPSDPGTVGRVAPPVGVVAGGFDIPYPARHRRLWQDVAAVGALVSEWPLGTRSEGWRFPARNRIIAALADAVVVVESRAAGGSIVTADQALVRDRPIFAVPGSVRSPASVGTNRLLREGAMPACTPRDVIGYLKLSVPGFSAPFPSIATRAEPSGLAGEVLCAVGWEPTPVEVVLRRCALARAEVTLQLAHLELDGWVTNGPAGWQRAGPVLS